MPLILTRPLLLLAGALTLPATQVSAAASQILLHSDPQSVNCPVTLYAQPRFTGGVTLLVPGQPSKRDRAGVHLRLEDPDGRPIRGAEIILRGLAATHGAQPASLGSSTQPTQSFHVVGGGDTPGVLTADLWLAHAVTMRASPSPRSTSPRPQPGRHRRQAPASSFPTAVDFWAACANPFLLKV